MMRDNAKEAGSREAKVRCMIDYIIEKLSELRNQPNLIETLDENLKQLRIGLGTLNDKVFEKQGDIDGLRQDLNDVKTYNSLVMVRKNELVNQKYKTVFNYLQSSKYEDSTFDSRKLQEEVDANKETSLEGVSKVLSDYITKEIQAVIEKAKSNSLN